MWQPGADEAIRGRREVQLQSFLPPQTCVCVCVLFPMIWRITHWSRDRQPLPSPKKFRAHRDETDLWVRLKPLTHHTPTSPC